MQFTLFPDNNSFYEHNLASQELSRPISSSDSACSIF